MLPSQLPPRTVEVAPERLKRWVAGFAERHGEFQTQVGGDKGDLITLVAADGSVAVIDPPFTPLAARPAADAVGSVVDAVAAEAGRTRVLGVLLVRLGGYAAGVFDGGELVGSKVGSRQVHGRSAAGGWSQQRFARRRVGQVRVALDAAVAAAVQVLIPALARIEVVVTGGDRQALRTVLDDPRLSAMRSRITSRILDVPDPKAKVLRDSYRLARVVRITITDVAPS